jgi:hypothetical protein
LAAALPSSSSLAFIFVPNASLLEHYACCAATGIVVIAYIQAIVISIKKYFYMNFHTFLDAY